VPRLIRNRFRLIRVAREDNILAAHRSQPSRPCSICAEQVIRLEAYLPHQLSANHTELIHHDERGGSQTPQLLQKSWA